MTTLKICLLFLCLLPFRAVGLPRFQGANFFMETEIWKDVKGFEGLYQVSNLGRVRSLPRMKPHSSGNGSFLKQGKILSVRPGTAFNGYTNVSFSPINSKQISLFLHRVIAQAFIPNTENKPFINHKNGIKTDNRIDNLEWVTRSENAKHAVRTGLQKVRLGANHPTSKLSESEVLSIRLRYSLGESSWRIFKSLGNMSYTNIKDIIFKRTWKHI